MLLNINKYDGIMKREEVERKGAGEEALRLLKP
jgi:hypothetical protein